MRVHIAVHKIILAIALAAWLPSMALALTPGQVYESVKDSVVVVRAYDRPAAPTRRTLLSDLVPQAGKQVGLGSGVMLPSGDIITNFHVIKAGVRYTVGRGKQAVSATLKSGDPDKDLCLLTAPGLVAEPARLGKAARLKVGDPVYAVGAPQGLELSLSEGIVSQLRGGPPPIIQTTVAISGGSSGGGLFNANGELVGITTFYLKDGQSLNFALPVEWIAEVARRKIRERPRGEADVASEPGAKLQPGWKDRAWTLMKAGNWQNLLAHSRRWTQAEPGNSEAWGYLGSAYAFMGRDREAVEAHREGLRLKPNDFGTWFNLGSEYESLGRYGEAVEAYREGLRLKPDLAIAWFKLGRAYAKLGRYGEAVEAYREGLRLKPDDADAWNYLAIVYALSGNRSAALEAIKELRRYDPKRAEELFNLIVKP